MRVAPIAVRLAGIVLLAGSVRAGETPAAPRMAWPIPAVAWRVPIGGLRHGVPIGGFGAGSIMVNAGGSFGPWHFKPGAPELTRRLRGAAFHFYEKPAGDPARVTALTAQRLMPAWTPLPPNAGTYHALYPKGWFVWRSFQAELSLKFYSPILKGDAKQTSYPVAVFAFVVANPTDLPLDVGILFTFPNAAGHTSELRSGFVNVVETDAEHKIAAVVLDANYEHNDAAANDSEWCIAARAEGEGELSYATSWNAMASGGDVLREFADGGRLPNEPLDSTDSAAAVAFRVRLEPKATVTVPFVLSWDFPLVRFGKTLWWRRYTEHVGREADKAYAIARDALLNYAEWEAAIDAWTQPIIANDAYPEWLRQAALNELYYTSFGGAFWEAGCVTDPREFKNLDPGDHKFATLASPTQPLCEPLAARVGSSAALRTLWPHLEREVLTTYADFILDAPEAAVHDLGSPAANPFFAYNAAAVPGAKDLPALFILQAWAYYQATGERAFLDHVWPACAKCAEPLAASRVYADGLPRHEGADAVASPCTLHGLSLLTGGLWIAAFDALDRMATVREDPRAATYRLLAGRARRSLDSLLWRPSLRYYAIDSRSRHTDALAAGALAGVRVAQATSLPSPLPEDRVHQHLRQVFERCVVPYRDYTGDRVGDVGAINVLGSDRCPPAVGQCHEVWLADTYRLAATMLRVGRDRKDKALVAAAHKTAYGPYYQTWAVAPDKPLWAFNTPLAWHADRPARARATQHIGARAIWEFLLEIHDPYAKPARAE